jgi:hypothetical protein
LRGAAGGRYQRCMPDPHIPREELQAALDARSELGRDLEPHLVDTFLDRVERSIDARADARIEARLRAAGGLNGARDRDRPGPSAATVVLALGSMAFGVGATGAATAFGDVMGFLAAVAVWTAIAAINVAHALRR